MGTIRDAWCEVPGAPRDRRPPEASQPATVTPDAPPVSPVQLRMLQASTGNRAAASLLRQPAPQPPAPAPPAPAVTWDALQSRFEALTLKYLRLDQIDVLRAERGDLQLELQRMWVKIGAPGEKTPAELTAVSKELDAFEEARVEDRKAALAAWPVLEEEYETERKRLVASPEVSDWRAAEYLDAAYERAKQRKAAAGNDLRWYDISALGHEMASEAHLKKGWERALRDTLAAHEEQDDESKLKAWPWPAFKATQLIVEGSAMGPHQGIQSAVKYQIRHAVAVMIEMGESEARAQAWAARALAEAEKHADHIAERLAPKAGVPTLGGHKWTHRLHVAGKFTVAIDVVGSVVDILAAPPKERPKKVMVHVSRIAGGLAGASVGARVGAKLGARFGLVGGVIGGIAGGIGGGFAGAWGAKKIATFIADEIWPPEDAYTESFAKP